MAKQTRRYEIGKKPDVMVLMSELAIRDQKALIYALTPNGREVDEATKKAIEDCLKAIRDFKKIGDVYRKQRCKNG